MDTSHIDDKKIKYFELLQNIITRMNSNSFMIKGWAITIVSAVLALLASTDNQSFIAITAVPILVFWISDSFYLQTERRFVTLYKKAIVKNSTLEAFSMDIKADAIKNQQGNSYFESFFSRTILSFYLSLLIVAVACIFFISNKKDDEKPMKVEVSSTDTIKLQTIPDTIKQ
ncbi:hypothetical protein HRG84_13460 [Flavisolibacter sp. BT320]|nr:hypothetical protein [Flavisolibacter longurius]